MKEEVKEEEGESEEGVFVLGLGGLLIWVALVSSSDCFDSESGDLVNGVSAWASVSSLEEACRRCMGM